MQVYDIIQFPDGRKFEVLQVLPDNICTLSPSSGGLPEKLEIPEGTEILESFLSEALELTSQEKFRNLIRIAEDKWKEHSSKTPAKGGRKSTSKPVIDLGISF